MRFKLCGESVCSSACNHYFQHVCGANLARIYFSVVLVVCPIRLRTSSLLHKLCKQANTNITDQHGINCAPKFLYHTHFSFIRVRLVCRAYPRVLAPSVPISLPCKLYRTKAPWFVHFARSVDNNHLMRTHLNIVKAQLICKACPSVLAPSLPMLLRSKL